jgi:hypothetical protein
MLLAAITANDPTARWSSDQNESLTSKVTLDIKHDFAWILSCLYQFYLVLSCCLSFLTVLACFIFLGTLSFSFRPCTPEGFCFFVFSKGGTYTYIVFCFFRFKRLHTLTEVNGCGSPLNSLFFLLRLSWNLSLIAASTRNCLGTPILSLHWEGSSLCHLRNC